MKVNLFYNVDKKSYKIEIVHNKGAGVVIKKFLSFWTVKIAQVLHLFSLRNVVYHILVSQKSIVLELIKYLNM